MMAGAGGGAVAVLSLILLTCWLRWRKRGKLRWRKARQMPTLTVQSSNVEDSSAQKSSGADRSKIEIHLDLKPDELQPAVSRGPVSEEL